MYIINALLIGLFSGYLSGQFGIGGAIISTPGLRLILKTGPYIALGTTLPVMIPSALSGLYNYYRSRFVDVRLGLYLAVFGLVGSVLGAYSTRYFNGDVLMLITSIVILFLSFRFLLPRGIRGTPLLKVSPNITFTGLLGFAIGFFAGFLGLGGGFLLIPSLVTFYKKSIKEAFGTSLFVILFYAIPGSITHYLLGHVDLTIMLMLVIGVIPGAYLGSRVTIALSERILNLTFGTFLLAVAVCFAVFELITLQIL